MVSRLLLPSTDLQPTRMQSWLPSRSFVPILTLKFSAVLIGQMEVPELRHWQLMWRILLTVGDRSFVLCTTTICPCGRRPDALRELCTERMTSLRIRKCAPSLTNTTRTMATFRFVWPKRSTVFRQIQLFWAHLRDTWYPFERSACRLVRSF